MASPFDYSAHLTQEQNTANYLNSPSAHLTQEQNTANYLNSPAGRSRGRATQKKTLNDSERARLLAQTGQKDTGQSLADLSHQSTGTNATLLSTDLGALKSNARPAGWFPNNTPRNPGNNATLTRPMAAQMTPAVNARDLPKPTQPVGTVVEQEIAPQTPMTLADGTKALRVDPKYVTPGASPIARAAMPANSGGLLSDSIQKQIVSTYPQVGVAGSKENQLFTQAFRKAHADRFAQTGQATPWNAEDAMDIAHSLFRPNQSVAGAPAAARNPGDPLYQNPTAGADITKPAVFGAQAPINFAGSDVGAAPAPNLNVPQTVAGKAGAATGNAAKSYASGAGDFFGDVGKLAYNNVALPIRNFVAPGEGRPFTYSNGSDSFGGAGKNPTPPPTLPAPSTPTSVTSNDFTLPPFNWSTPSKVATNGSIGASAVSAFSGGAPVLTSPDAEKKKKLLGLSY